MLKINMEVGQMGKYRAIPEGYMRVGELAKKVGVTVRALQFYDKEGLLSPSAESEGGFRLYDDKDMAKLIQILMMKQLGFTLAEIKKRLTSLDTTSDVIGVLTDHASGIRGTLKALSESLDEIEALAAEIAQMQSVDFKKFAAILMSLQRKNEHYWIIKHFDDDMFDRFQSFNYKENPAVDRF
jgi:DNA-binding transcriptional MerR regulator